MSNLPEDHLLCEVRDNFAVLTLNRPERFNALTHALVRDLRLKLEALDADAEVRAIILTGSGKAFCSGADLGSSGSSGKTVTEILTELYNPLISQMITMNTPIVAAINGITAGAGLSLALGADVRICTSEASFSSVFVKMGLVPDAGATWLLPRIVGLNRATEMALLGRKVDAAGALTWGLVNEVTEPNLLMKVAGDTATEIAALPASVAAVRKLLKHSLDSGFAAQLDLEVEAQMTAYEHPHFIEARAAFLEKRRPQFY